MLHHGLVVLHRRHLILLLKNLGLQSQFRKEVGLVGEENCQRLFLAVLEMLESHFPVLLLGGARPDALIVDAFDVDLIRT